MRIISGSARGRRLVAPSNETIRPTRDRVREALFSILGNVEGTVVVDGFAGTGALGCEALSRGAKRCYFFDPSPEAIDLIRENVARIGAQDRATIFKCDFRRGLELRLGEEVDLLFVDPPYDSELVARALETMAESPWITEDALAVVELGSKQDIPEQAGFVIEDQRRYGVTQLAFYRRRPSNEPEPEIGS